MKCKFEKAFRGGYYKCPHDAESGGDYCFWHKEEDGKDLKGKDLKGENLADAYLRKADFRNANLENANFIGANLEYANFIEANLKNAILYGTHLASADFGWANLENANLGWTWCRYVSFYGADLRNVNLHGAKIENSLNLQYAKLDEDHIVINERDGDKEKNNDKKLEKYSEASDVYITLKNYFRKVGRYDRSGKYFIGEWRVRGKKYKLKKNYPSWLINRFLDHFSRYGESPQRVFALSILFVFVLGLVYWHLGAIVNSSDPSKTVSLPESLHFSVVTFTTLGYGDYYPKQSFQFLADLEAFSGMFIMAFFVVTVARKIMR
ncbi:MAG: hypothetical protein A7316_01795 [Candidatus Altiarchaeales archaeon WOR_SM1_86-2]|nr:MAG: hypothetical protein A7316_01795 [Candidatus Altiarchaeales archaeon WOR_SM1_86-2]